jgi:hypothetical protein
METKIVDSEKLKTHPMEDILDIESGTTAYQVSKRESTEIAATTTEAYDDKDIEIETQFQEVFDAAMDAYDSQIGTSEDVEGKYQARNGEVAVQFLATALQAAKEKSSTKMHKDKMNIARGKLTTAGKAKNNLIIADRNDILKAMQAQSEKIINE